MIRVYGKPVMVPIILEAVQAS